MESASYWLAPAAILLSAAIGFSAAWFTGLLNRRRTAISELVTATCTSIDSLRELAVDYWISDAHIHEDCLKKEHRILAVQQSISLQISHLIADQKTWKPEWYRYRPTAEDNDANDQAVRDALLEFVVTGGDFGSSARKADPTNCRRVISKAERLKHEMRSRRQRY